MASKDFCTIPPFASGTLLVLLDCQTTVSDPTRTAHPHVHVTIVCFPAQTAPAHNPWPNALPPVHL